MTDHTSTPWKTEKDYLDVEGWAIFQSTESMAVECIAHSIKESNAAFIVKAVNCHDELVGLLREMYRGCTPDTCDDDLAIRVNAILAKAGAA
jgi:hypothetical protein